MTYFDFSFQMVLRIIKRKLQDIEYELEASGLKGFNPVINIIGLSDLDLEASNYYVNLWGL